MGCAGTYLQAIEVNALGAKVHVETFSDDSAKMTGGFNLRCLDRSFVYSKKIVHFPRFVLLEEGKKNGSTMSVQHQGLLNWEENCIMPKNHTEEVCTASRTHAMGGARTKTRHCTEAEYSWEALNPLAKP